MSHLGMARLSAAVVVLSMLHLAAADVVGIAATLQCALNGHQNSNSNGHIDIDTTTMTMMQEENEAEGGGSSSSPMSSRV